MIGLVLGTTEGKKILSRMNVFTDDIYISTATKYGLSIYYGLKYKHANTQPLDAMGFEREIKKFDIDTFIDVSHPYASEVSDNLLNACRKCEVKYIRYERCGVAHEFKDNPEVVLVDGYKDIVHALKNIGGTVLNTTGSRNIETILNLNIKNRILHRVLPMSKVILELESLDVKLQDIIAIKMDPKVQEINQALFKVYDIKALITKDSGVEGGTGKKIEAAIKSNIKVIVIKKKGKTVPNTFDDIDDLVEHCIKAGII